MADDIVNLLRHFAALEGAGEDIVAIELAAADEIERLRAESKAWQTAAQAYKRGWPSLGDRLTKKARRD